MYELCYLNKHLLSFPTFEITGAKRDVGVKNEQAWQDEQVKRFLFNYLLLVSKRQQEQQQQHSILIIIVF